MEELVSTELLESYRTILSDWIPTGSSIAIAVGETFVYFASGSSHLSVRIGSKVPKDSVAYQVIQTREKIDAIMETALFESPYYAIGYPINIHGSPAALVIILPPLYKPQHNQLEFITARDQNDDYIPIMVSDILYIESLQKKTWIYRNEESFKTTITLKELQTRLPSNFIRIHRSYIINLYYIERISKDYSSNYIVHLKNGSELSVSHSYMNNLKDALEF